MNQKVYEGMKHICISAINNVLKGINAFCFMCGEYVIMGSFPAFVSEDATFQRR